MIEISNWLIIIFLIVWIILMCMLFRIFGRVVQKQILQKVCSGFVLQQCVIFISEWLICNIFVCEFKMIIQMVNKVVVMMIDCMLKLNSIISIGIKVVSGVLRNMLIQGKSSLLISWFLFIRMLIGILIMMVENMLIVKVQDVLDKVFRNGVVLMIENNVIIILESGGMKKVMFVWLMIFYSRFYRISEDMVGRWYL